MQRLKQLAKNPRWMGGRNLFGVGREHADSDQPIRIQFSLGG